MTLLDLFARLPESPCGEAEKWAEGRNADEAAYLACERGDHMLWIAEVLGVDRRLLVLAACDCAERTLRFAWAQDVPVLRETLRVARAWTRGEATIEEVRAVEAARAAAAGTWAREEARAAGAASRAAREEAAAAWAAEHRACADIVRRHIPWSMIAPLVEGLK